MAKTRAEELQEAHNDGEKDAANGSMYIPPTNAFSFLVGQRFDSELNEAYTQGFQNSKKQK